MSGRYERVSKATNHLRESSGDASGTTTYTNSVGFQINPSDDEDATSPVNHLSTHNAVPHSPPPSFHSRASSPARRNQVDPDLADAFDDPDDDSDADEADDRRRLVRDSDSSIPSPQLDPSHTVPGVSPAVIASGGSSRVMGGGVGTDGVFANMSARPDRIETEKDEQPPVSLGPKLNRTS
jgi:hypothetical protein